MSKKKSVLPAALTKTNAQRDAEDAKLAKAKALAVKQNPKQLEKLAAEINDEHQALVKRSADSIWIIGSKLIEFRTLVDEAEFKWDEWCQRLALGRRSIETYMQFAKLYHEPPTAFKLDGPKGTPNKLRQLSVREYIDAAKEAEKDGVAPMDKVLEKQAFDEAKEKVAAAKARKTEVIQKLTKAKKELADIPARTGPTREKQQKLVSDLEAEAGELDPEVAAAEAELEKVERKRANSLEPQSFFEALTLIGINFAKGKWTLEVPAAIAFGFIHNSGLPSGAMEKKVWEPYFVRLADTLKRTKASKHDLARFDACVKFFKEG